MAKNLFESEGYQLENVWEPTTEAMEMPNSFKQKVKEIKIRRTTYEGTPIVNAVVFFNNGDKPKSYKVSPYSEAYEYSTGTKIDPDSMTLQSFKNQEGIEKTLCDCQEL